MQSPKQRHRPEGGHRWQQKEAGMTVRKIMIPELALLKPRKQKKMLGDPKKWDSKPEALNQES